MTDPTTPLAHYCLEVSWSTGDLTCSCGLVLTVDPGDRGDVASADAADRALADAYTQHVIHVPGGRVYTTSGKIRGRHPNRAAAGSPFNSTRVANVQRPADLPLVGYDGEPVVLD